MNKHPAYIATHMRAKMAGHPYASCYTCTTFYEKEPDGWWCALKKDDPHPQKTGHETLCKKYDPRPST